MDWEWNEDVGELGDKGSGHELEGGESGGEVPYSAPDCDAEYEEEEGDREPCPYSRADGGTDLIIIPGTSSSSIDEWVLESRSPLVTLYVSEEAEEAA